MSPSLSNPSLGGGVHSVQQVIGSRVASFPGKFGTGIQSYFSFLRFLVVLNLVIFLIIFMLVLLPILLTKYKITNSTFVFVPFKDMGEWKGILILGPRPLCQSGWVRLCCRNK